MTVLCLAVASCSELPISGPHESAIVGGAAAIATRPTETVAYAYALVDLDAFVVRHVSDIDGGSLHGSFGKGKGPAPAVYVGPGDVLQVTIFESKSGGLFIPADSGVRPGNYVTLPPMTVSHSGTIAVPYSGDIKAAGKSVEQIEREIENKIADRAIDPKVIVTVAEQNASTVSVVGDVNTAKKVRLTQNGERILDLIAQAGGPHYPGYETFVTLQRRDRQATIYFNNLVSHPEENIYAAPGDTVYVFREPRRFVALGAVGVAVGVGASSALTGLSSLFTFDQDRLTLAEAVGKAGGLLDFRANPAQVFLYRLEFTRNARSYWSRLKLLPARPEGNSDCVSLELPRPIKLLLRAAIPDAQQRRALCGKRQFHRGREVHRLCYFHHRWRLDCRCRRRDYTPRRYLPWQGQCQRLLRRKALNVVISSRQVAPLRTSGAFPFGRCMNASRLRRHSGNPVDRPGSLVCCGRTYAWML